MDPALVYKFLSKYIWHLICVINAILGFALRLRGYRKASTVFIIIAYVSIFILPLLWYKYQNF